MRKRVINVEKHFFNHKEVEMLGARGLHLYNGLCCIAEDFGSFSPDYADIAWRMGAFTFSADEVELQVRNMAELQLLVAYRGDNGKWYYWIPEDLREMPLNNSAPPRLPMPEWVTCDIRQYKSGKKWAKYHIIESRLPVDYRYPTGSSQIGSNRKGREGEGKSSERSEAVLSSFNKICNRDYKVKDPILQEPIEVLYEAGYKEEILIAVAQVKSDEWQDDMVMKENLNPLVVYSKGKFPIYLEQAVRAQKQEEIRQAKEKAIIKTGWPYKTEGLDKKAQEESIAYVEEQKNKYGENWYLLSREGK